MTVFIWLFEFIKTNRKIRCFETAFSQKEQVSQEKGPDSLKNPVISWNNCANIIQIN